MRSARFLLLAVFIHASLIAPAFAVENPPKKRPSTAGSGAVAQPIPDRDLAKSRFATGTMLFRRGEYREALVEFEEAKKILPNPAFDYNIGLCLEKLNQPAAAADALERYMNTKPDEPDAANIWKKIAALRGDAVNAKAAAPAVVAAPTSSASASTAAPAPGATTPTPPASRAKVVAPTATVATSTNATPAAATPGAARPVNAATTSAPTAQPVAATTTPAPRLAVEVSAREAKRIRMTRAAKAVGAIGAISTIIGLGLGSWALIGDKVNGRDMRTQALAADLTIFPGAALIATSIILAIARPSAEKR